MMQNVVSLRSALRLKYRAHSCTVVVAASAELLSRLSRGGRRFARFTTEVCVSCLSPRSSVAATLATAATATTTATRVVGRSARHGCRVWPASRWNVGRGRDVGVPRPEWEPWLSRDDMPRHAARRNVGLATIAGVTVLKRVAGAKCVAKYGASCGRCFGGFPSPLPCASEAVAGPVFHPLFCDAWTCAFSEHASRAGYRGTRSEEAPRRVVR